VLPLPAAAVVVQTYMAVPSVPLPVAVPAPAPPLPYLPEQIREHQDPPVQTQPPEVSALGCENLAPKIAKLVGRPASSALILELCAGSGTLTACLRARGLDAYGFDWEGNRFEKRAPIIILDLSTPHSLAMLKEILANNEVEFVWAGLPCGTCSRARERPIPKHLKKKGAPQPRQLRDAAEPYGVTWLRPPMSAREQAMLTSSNAIYATVAAFLLHCTLLAVPWAIENPTNSWLWHIPEIAHLARFAVRVSFAACMHGSERPKLTSLMTTLPGLCSLSMQCDGLHKHLPWGVKKQQGKWHFATADEACYPRLLCRRIAEILVTALELKNYVFPPDTDLDSLPPHKQARLEQPRAPLPALVSEFERTFDADVPANTQLNAKLELQTSSGLKLCKVLRLRPCVNDGGGRGRSIVSAVVGAFRSPADFVSACLDVVHPVDRDPLHPLLRTAVDFVTTNSADFVSRHRKEFITELRGVVLRTAADEAEIHAALPLHRRSVLHGKKLLALEWLRVKCSHEDASLVADITEGFSLTGINSRSGAFAPKTRLRQMTEAQLLNSSKWINATISGRMGPSADPKQDLAVNEETMKELGHKWLEGPYSAEQLDKSYPDGWIASRRFAVFQSGKWRVIDDYSESFVNSTYELREHVDLQGIDDALALSSQLLKAMGGSAQLMGRTCDLKSAYRQLPVADCSAWCAILAVWQDGAVRYYQQRALPFGSVASVVAFNRFSRFLWRCAVQLGMVTWTNYVDDFPMIDLKIHCLSSWITVEAMFMLTGVVYATEPKKRKPAATCFGMLGVELDFTESLKGIIVVKNTSARVAELTSSIQLILDADNLPPFMARALVGRMIFAERQVFGGAASQVIQLIQSRGQATNRFGSLDDLLRCALLWVQSRLLSSPPRTFFVADPRPPVLIFTDGAAEMSSGITCGAIIFDSVSQTVQQFGGTVPAAITDVWLQSGSKQVIHQCELWPAVAARLVWAPLLQHRKVLIFIDNEAARVSLIKGNSGNQHSARLVWAFHDLDIEQQCRMWVARVPSCSNPADAPSRLEFLENERLFSAITIAMPSIELTAGSKPWEAKLGLF
jgi:hypothetical protein